MQDPPKVEALYTGPSEPASDVVWEAVNPFPSTLLVLPKPPFVTSPTTPHILQVTRVNGQAEARLDGRRIALVNVPPEHKNTALLMHLVGTKMRITYLRGDVLE